MKLSTFIFLVLLQSNISGQDLGKYQWKSRLIILSGNKNDPEYIQQKEVLVNFEDDLIERNLVIIEADDKLRNQLQLHQKFKGILLLGKDGRIKLKEAFIVEAETLFAIIDAMPMRKAELKKTKG